MIGCIGDLVEDVVVRLGGSVNIAADTEAVVVRRRGGSAANVAVSLARAGQAARFIGRVGDEIHGAALLDELRGEGVDVVARIGGRTGTVVVLLDQHGERTMLTDRGASTDLDHPERNWLEGLSTLHVPAYSLACEPLASTTITLIGWAHDQGITVSVDASSTTVIDAVGVDEFRGLLTELRPSVLLCNEMEAAALGDAVEPNWSRHSITIVKRGAGPASVLQHGSQAIQVSAQRIDDVRDTTGAGDAFAAGFLAALAAGSSAIVATTFGHDSAARAIRAASNG